MSIAAFGKVVIGAFFLISSQAPASTPTVRPKAGIEGIVTTDDPMPKPVSNAWVTLQGAASTEAQTDSNGHFLFKDLDAGAYRLTVTHDGFVRSEYGQRTKSAPGAPLNVGDGQLVHDIVFRLERTGAIAGTIRDEDGEPIAHAVVFALRAAYDSRGEQQMSQQFATRSDDRGDYRLYYMTPGDYYVAAVYTKDPQGPMFAPPNPNETPERDGYVPVYFPNAIDPAKAAFVQLAAGGDIGGIDFAMRRLPAVTVRGVVVNGATGRPVAAQSRFAPRVTDVVSRGVAVQAKEDGTFTVRGITPGVYTFFAASLAPGGPSGVVTVDVRDRDIDNLQIVLSAGVAVKGVVRVEPGTDGRTPALVGGATLLLASADPASPVGGNAPIRSEGPIVIPGVQKGEYRLQILNLPESFYLKSAAFGNTDVLRAPIAIGDDVPDDVLNLTISANGGTLSGLVVDASGKPISGAAVALVPNGDLPQRTDYYKSATSDPAGKFSLRGVAPGDYQVFAWESIEPRAWLNAEAMRPYLGQGQAVHLQSGDNVSVTVHLIPQ